MPEENNHLPATTETICNVLLNEIYKTEAVNFYDYAASQFAATEDSFKMVKAAASHLVKEKLAFYADEQHTSISVSNYGRYWILKGGYLSFLQSGHEVKEAVAKEPSTEKHHSKEELLEARLKLTHFRLIAFWLMILLSAIGFAFSIFNFIMLAKGRK